MNKLAT